MTARRIRSSCYLPDRSQVQSTNQSAAHPQPSAAEPATDSAAQTGNSQVHNHPSHTVRIATQKTAAAGALAVVVASTVGVAALVAELVVAVEVPAAAAVVEAPVAAEPVAGLAWDTAGSAMPLLAVRVGR